jgi:UDP-N-acetylglucosamine 2-epimerase (non-hydrolysing)
MPEEHNRIAVDHISEFLFAPTKQTKMILENEKVHGRIFVTGNTSIDAIEQNIKNVEKKTSFSVQKEDFVLVTLHRGENVDNPQTLSSIVEALLRSNVNMIFPAHPRTINRLRKFGLYNKIKNSQKILLLPAVGYFDMLQLMKKCRFIISDSGGVQEEATSPKIRKKVLVVRKTTDRPEAVSLGYSEIVGTSTGQIVNAIKKNLNDSTIHSHVNPYGTGNASQKIINILQKSL